VKILVFHNFLKQRRGAEIFLLNILLALKKRGHQIDIFLLDASQDYIKRLKENGIRINIMGFKEQKTKRTYLSLFVRTINNLRAFYLYYRFINRIKESYDIALVHHYLYSPLALPFLKIPKVYFSQEPPRAYYEPGYISYRFGFTKPLNIPLTFFNRFLDRYCVRFADLVISNSDYTREYIYRVYGIFAKTVHLGVDLQKFRRFEDIKKENLILSVGPFYSIKAHDFVIRSLAKIHKDKRPKLIIAGEGGDKEKLLDLANHFKVELEIRSRLNEQQMVELYNKAILTVAASIMEPFGLSVVESMACHTPVVAIREGGFREIVTEETGILVDRNEKEFSQAIQYLLQNPEIAQELGKKARERVEKYFSLEKSAEELEKSLLRAINESIIH